MPQPQSDIKYLISAICLCDGIVTHYYVHPYYGADVSSTYKISIDELKRLFVEPGISVYTAEWDYAKETFVPVQQVFIKIRKDSYYFHLLPETRKTKNLRHLATLAGGDH